MINFIISIALGVIVYIVLLLSGGLPPSSGDGAILVGILRVMFSSIAAGTVAGFFAGKSIKRSIGAACLSAIIGYIGYTNIYLGYSLGSILGFIPTISTLLVLIPAIIGGAAGRFIKKRSHGSLRNNL